MDRRASYTRGRLQALAALFRPRRSPRTIGGLRRLAHMPLRARVRGTAAQGKRQPGGEGGAAPRGTRCCDGPTGQDGGCLDERGDTRTRLADGEGHEAAPASWSAVGNLEAEANLGKALALKSLAARTDDHGWQCAARRIHALLAPGDGLEERELPRRGGGVGSVEVAAFRLPSAR